MLEETFKSIDIDIVNIYQLISKVGFLATLVHDNCQLISK